MWTVAYAGGMQYIMQYKNCVCDNMTSCSEITVMSGEPLLTEWVCCSVITLWLDVPFMPIQYMEFPDVINIKPISNRTSYRNAHKWRPHRPHTTLTESIYGQDSPYLCGWFYRQGSPCMGIKGYDVRCHRHHRTFT